jgi:hypothetical protein
MSNIILYALALLLTIIWAVSFFIYDVSNAIHVLLVLAAIAILVGIAQQRKEQ